MKIDLRDKADNSSAVAIKVNRPEDNSEAYRLCVRADALRFANLFQESIPKYLQSIMLERKNPESYYGLGVAYKFLGKYEKAITTLLQAVEQDPKNFNAYYELGLCYLLSGMPDNAIKMLQQSLMINPDNAEAQIQLAYAHELVGETVISEQIYNKLIETKHGYLKAYTNKASLMICQGNYFEASKLFFEVIKLNPDYYNAYYGIGVCFENMNKPVQARRYYKKYLQLKPAAKQADFLHSKLKYMTKKNSNMSNPFELIR